MGNFANLVLENQITDIPDEDWKDDKKRTEYQLLLLLDLEYSYRRYLKLVESLPVGLSPEEAVAILSQARQELVQKIVTKGE